MKASGILAFMQHAVVYAIALLAASMLTGCARPTSPAAPGPETYRGQERFGLSFEDRMALPAELSRLRADAERRADEMYDPFRSKDDAIRNEEMRVRLFDEAKNGMLEEKSLTPEQLDEIVREYQLSLGGNLR